MKKQILLSITAMLVSIAAIANNGDEFRVKTVEGVEMLFRIISSETKTVQVGSEYNPDQTIPQSYQGGITIPSSVTYENEEYGVTTISQKAFMNCQGLNSIKIPNGVKTIEQHAFYNCKNLTSVEIPSSVTIIEAQAFQGCGNLQSVTIQEGLITLGNTAFAGCTSLASIDIPNSVSCIEYGAFYGCTSLASIKIVNNTGIDVGKDAFGGCSNLTSLFLDCPEIGAWFAGAHTEKIKVILGSNVKKIGDSAFHSFSGLTSIEIPNSVYSIGADAFAGCNIKSLTIPGSITYIGERAFNMSSLESIKFEDGIKYIGGFSNSNKLSKIVIPHSVNAIGASAFSDCTWLTSIDIPNSVTSIGDNAFKGCTGLNSAQGEKSVDNPHAT